MIKIAIVSTFNYHLECLGFLLEYLKEYKIDIFIVEDNYKYLDYFQTLFNFNFKHIHEFNEDRYDKIIKLSSNDPYIIKKRHISILHYKGFEKFNNCKFITLSPFVIPIKNSFEYKYILSIHNNYINNKINGKNLAFIGLVNIDINKDFFKDLVNLKDNIGGKIYYLGRIKYKNNIINKSKINTINMINMLKNCSYIVIREHNDRYTGALSHALSLGIPIIIKKNIASIYKIPCLTYNHNINELENTINTMTIEKYINHKEKLKEFSNREIVKNKLKLINFIKDI